ncbi:aminotransferase class V-fold PLP-dependent enzyme [Ilumatobacter nonamiensis]|uniref:aminotransferase class V-fold PLP-dependent enzyme n=1 Tax=Ilumatobacter nonamiensis TaxID=467093 RepID=UPI00034C62B2|nr:aminotransferase class V-fold PLP-dependent enzyme [Ilumatobacter nonamiensis]
MTSLPSLDVEFVRTQFPAFGSPENDGTCFFDNAAGSYACRQTIDALTDFYTHTKVQPYSPFGPSERAGELMDRSRERWAEALGVDTDEVVFGPSTSMNTYVLAQAFGQWLSADDEVIVTNQDHEANTGSTRRMAERLGCPMHEWRTNPDTGLLDVADLEALLNERTRLVTVPHASNIVGQENEIARICELAHAVGARVIVDGVSFVPHGIPDVAALGADVYLFSLYKVYSVHQGVMVVRRELLNELPNQGHFFNDSVPHARLNPAGPDHAQVGCAAAVLDYVETLHRHHGGDPADSLRRACADVSELWQAHEDALTVSLLDAVAGNDRLRLLGPAVLDVNDGHRCPTVAVSPTSIEPEALQDALIARGVQTTANHFYGWRCLDGMGVDPERGALRLSFVHYTTEAEVDRVIQALDEIVG